MSSWLSRDTFRTIVDTAPLISIDLLVRDSAGRILVGKRVNRPAKGFWFVPGGRILKNETIAEAFLRLTEAELAQKIDISSARYLGWPAESLTSRSMEISGVVSTMVRNVSRLSQELTCTHYR